MYDDSVTEKLNVYGSQDIEAPLQKYVKDDGNYSFNINVVNAFEKFVADGYKITPLKATHGTANPFIYIIEKDGKALLYGNDTGVFPEETFDYLKNSSVELDYVSLDCTAGPYVTNLMKLTYGKM